MAGRPPKPIDDLKTEFLRVPVTVAQKQAIVSAAESANLPAAVWARELLLRAAQRQRADAAK